MHKTSSKTKIAFTVKKIIIKRFEVSGSKPIPIGGENNMLENESSRYYAGLDFKCFVRDMSTRSFQQLIAQGVII